MMKKLLLSMLSMMVMSAVSAQSDRVVTYLKPYVPEHEIRVGYSPLMPFIFGCADGEERNWTEWGAASLYYNYRIKRWLEVGGVFTYSGAFNTVRERVVDNIARLTIAPNVRFSWYNSRVIRLYSSISLGFGVEIWNESTGAGNERRTMPVYSGQLSPFGMSVGRKFFFYIEPFCIGTQGNLVLAGFGYRFPAKEQSVKY